MKGENGRRLSLHGRFRSGEGKKETERGNGRRGIDSLTRGHLSLEEDGGGVFPLSTVYSVERGNQRLMVRPLLANFLPLSTP